MANSMEYLDPTLPRPGGKLVAPAVSDLRGKVIGFLSNGWSSFDKIGVRMRTILVEQYGVQEMRHYSIPSSVPPPAGLFAEVARDCHVAVVGLAN